MRYYLIDKERVVRGQIWDGVMCDDLFHFLQKNRIRYSMDGCTDGGLVIHHNGERIDVPRTFMIVLDGSNIYRYCWDVYKLFEAYINPRCYIGKIVDAFFLSYQSIHDKECWPEWYRRAYNGNGHPSAFRNCPEHVTIRYDFSAVKSARVGDWLTYDGRTIDVVKQVDSWKLEVIV